MLTQYAFSILFIDKKKAKFSNDRFGIKQKTNLTEEQRQEALKNLKIQEMNIHADSRNGSQIEIGVTYNEWKKNM